MITYAKRPKWPYDLWTFEKHKEEKNEEHGGTEKAQTDSVEVNSSETEDNTPKTEHEMVDKTVAAQDDNLTGAPSDATTEYKEEVNKPLHWTDALDADISEACPINNLIRATALPNASETDEALQLKDLLMAMMEATLKELTASNQLFQGSRLHLAGSMAENTKVGNADEFDFAVIVPALAQKEYLELLDSFDENNWRMPLPRLWYMTMRTHVPEGWEVLEAIGHPLSSNVAATFHLQLEVRIMVNLDVYFWIPMDKESLLESKFTQKHYLAQHCLDENGILYLVLPQERNGLDDIRLAMSGLEKLAFNKYGVDNGRLQCYRTCKCLVSALLPKIKKEYDCDFCFDSLASSFRLKNIVLYMAENHTDDDFWTREKLPNRVLEVFIILTRCMENGRGLVSAYFTPSYNILTEMYAKYDQETASMYSPLTGSKRCDLPDLSQIKEHFIEDPLSQTAVADYERFLGSTKWDYTKVICRVTELLTNLMQED